MGSERGAPSRVGDAWANPRSPGTPVGLRRARQRGQGCLPTLPAWFPIACAAGGAFCLLASLSSPLCFAVPEHGSGWHTRGSPSPWGGSEPPAAPSHAPASSPAWETASAFAAHENQDINASSDSGWLPTPALRFPSYPPPAPGFSLGFLCNRFK